MNNNEMQQMALLEDTYWWHVGRKSIIKNMLKSINIPSACQIINIGCGTGGCILTLETFGRVTNYDVSGEAIRICRDKGFNNSHLFNGKKLPCDDNLFDVAAALDVLEHVENDNDALKDWFRILKPDGRLLITVPAYQWLWSGHDEALGHYRRYTASQLHQKLNQAGFSVGKRSYAITFSFPLILGYRLLDSLRRSDRTPAASYVLLPRPVNAVLTALLKLEALLLRFMNFPVGTSVVIIAKKPKQ
ncbi:MAG: class I SAM-dependent methyltransferase [Kiritimatiellales bacterium]